MPDVNMLLYRGCKAAAFIAFLFGLYLNVYGWFFVPFADFGFYWRPEHQLKISVVDEDSLANPALQVEDEVLAIDGKPIHRSATVFTGTTQSSYQYTIRRGNDIQVAEVPFSAQPTEIGLSYRLPTGLLTLAFFVVGTAIFYFATEDNRVAIRVGYIFVVQAVAILGLQMELISVPGAWTSRLLWYVSGLTIPYLGLVPRNESLSPRVRQVFKWSTMTGLMLGIAAFLEAALLFPRFMSIEQLLGVGLYELALFIGGTGWLVAFVLLAVRARKILSAYDKQQIQVLLFVMGLAILPVTVLTVLPRVLFGEPFLPFPVAILLFVLVPAGYFFVIYRRGYLGLDVVFSKMVIFVTLAIAMVAVYGSGLLTIQGQFHFAPGSILPATIMLLPTLLLTVYSAKPIDRLVQGLIFGPVMRNQSLPEFASALSSKPELSTLEYILQSVTKDFDISQAALLLLDDTGLLSLAAQINVTKWSPDDRHLQPFHQPLLRSAVVDKIHHPLFNHNWIELALPVKVRSKQIGFLILARPRGGYFNAEQVAFLRRVTDMIAVGSEAIYLFKASRQLSSQLLSAQEMERKHLASLIHDQPLQMLTFANHNIDGILTSLRDSVPQAAQSLKEQAERIQMAMAELRDICVGLYPPVIDHGVEWVAEEVTEQFWQKFGLCVHKQLDISETTDYPSDVSTAVYKVMTEALNNVVKHARTQEAWVDLSYRDAVLRLVVADQGAGSRLHHCSASEVVRQQHLGLAGMFRWADLVNGRLSLTANEPHGTKVILEIPLTNE